MTSSKELELKKKKIRDQKLERQREGSRERQRDFRAARNAEGLVLFREWVPKQCVETLRRIAAEMRWGRQAPTSTDPSEPSPKPSGTSGSPKA
jgi:hypothetical protein